MAEETCKTSYNMGLNHPPLFYFLKNGDKMGHVVTVVSCDGNIIEVSNYGKREQIDISHFFAD